MLVATLFPLTACTDAGGSEDGPDATEGSTGSATDGPGPTLDDSSDDGDAASSAGSSSDGDRGGDDTGTDGSGSEGTGADDTGTDDTGTDDTGSDDTGGPPDQDGPDIDGDGLGDFVVGARGVDSFAGALWIYYGASDSPIDSLASADVRITGANAGQNLGLASAICDVDGDGVDDLLAASLDGVHVYWGGQTLESSSTEDLLVEGSITVVRGLRCADVTGDGVNDIVSAGATFTNWMLTVVPGGMHLRDVATLDPTVEPDVVIIDGTDGTLVPQIDVGDFNGDDSSDILVGAPQAGAPMPPGAAYIFFGGDTLASGTDADADVVMIGEEPNARLGTSLVAGDFTDDGIDDWAVAATHTIDIYLGAPALAMAMAPQVEEITSSPSPVHVDVARQIVSQGSTFGGLGTFGNAAAVDIFFSDESSQRLAAFYDIIGADPFVCAADVSGYPPLGYSVRDPAAVGLEDEAPVAVVILTEHGATDPITGMPDGPGAISAWDIIEDDCEPVAASPLMAIENELANAGGLERQEVVADPDLWSGYISDI